MVESEKEWRVEDDLRTLQRAEEIRQDKKRLAAAMKLADKRAVEMTEMIKREKGLRG